MEEPSWFTRLSSAVRSLKRRLPVRSIAFGTTIFSLGSLGAAHSPRVASQKQLDAGPNAKVSKLADKFLLYRSIPQDTASQDTSDTRRQIRALRDSLRSVRLQLTAARDSLLRARLAADQRSAATLEDSIRFLRLQLVATRDSLRRAVAQRDSAATPGVAPSAVPRNHHSHVSHASHSSHRSHRSGGWI